MQKRLFLVFFVVSSFLDISFLEAMHHKITKVKKRTRVETFVCVPEPTDQTDQTERQLKTMSFLSQNNMQDSLRIHIELIHDPQKSGYYDTVLENFKYVAKLDQIDSSLIIIDFAKCKERIDLEIVEEMIAFLDGADGYELLQSKFDTYDVKKLLQFCWAADFLDCMVYKKALIKYIAQHPERLKIEKKSKLCCPVLFKTKKICVAYRLPRAIEYGVQREREKQLYQD